MALKVINKINCKLKIVYSKNRIVRSGHRKILYNTLIQLHFDYACPV